MYDMYTVTYIYIYLYLYRNKNTSNPKQKNRNIKSGNRKSSRKTLLKKAFTHKAFCSAHMNEKPFQLYITLHKGYIKQAEQRSRAPERCMVCRDPERISRGAYQNWAVQDHCSEKHGIQHLSLKFQEMGIGMRHACMQACMCVCVYL